LKAGRCIVDEDRSADGEGYDGAEQLTGGEKSDGLSDVVRRDFSLDNRETRLGVHSRAETDEGSEAVDAGGSCGASRGIHQGRADQAERSAKDKEGRVVSDFGDKGATGNRAEDEGEDDREKSNGRLEGRIASGELKVKGNIVEGDESQGGGCGDEDEEQNSGPHKQHLNGEDSSFLGLPRHVKRLTEGKKHRQHTKGDEGSDDLSTAPSIFVSAEGKGENDGDDRADEEDGSDPIDLLYSFPVGLSLLCVKVGDEEGEDGDDNAADGEIDVEGPSPACAAVGKCAANDGSEDRSETPHGTSLHVRIEQRKGFYEREIRETYHSDICWALSFARVDRNKEKRAGVNCCGANASNRTSDDEGVDIWRSSTNGASDFENQDAQNVEPFGIEDLEKLSKGEHECSAGKEKGGCEPGYFIDGLEFFYDGGLDIGDDCIVEGKQK
jgi:hypothetical protein